METNFENYRLINFCIKRPIACLLILMGCFAAFIFVDQTLLAGSEMSSLIQTELESSSKVELYSTTYIGWLSTNPDFIQSYKCWAPNGESGSALISVENIQAAIRNGADFIEFNFRVAERILQIVFSKE